MLPTLECALIRIHTAKSCEMEVLADDVLFIGGGSHQRKCQVLAVTFKRLINSSGDQEDECEFGWKDLLHAVAGLCSTSLPDMELSAVYSSLTAAGTRTVVALSSRRAVLQQRAEQGSKGAHSKHRKERERVSSCEEQGSGGSVKKEPAGTEQQTSGSSGAAAGSEGGEENPFTELFSGAEASESEGEDVEQCDEWTSGREAFLTEARRRKSLDPQSLESVGPEHCVVGCATVMRLSNKPGSSAVQLTLMAVRKGLRCIGVGRYLMQCCKDPEVVGHYDALLAFADHKAEGFFSRHGFSDDPIISSKYSDVVDHWENSTLVAYVPPFSGPGVSVGSMKALTRFEEHFRTWRSLAIGSYCEQLGLMERLRHEVILLHSKLQSQEEVIAALGRQLREAKEEKALLQNEFQQYRRQTQKLMRSTAVGDAEQWLRNLQCSDMT